MAKTTRVKTWLYKKEVIAAVKQAQIPALIKCGLVVEREAKISMRTGGKVQDASGKIKSKPSAPGTPPNVQEGNLKSSIQTAGPTNTGTILVGPTKEAWYGKIHEFGSRFHPKRPFMRPALQRMKSLFPKMFASLPLGTTMAGRSLNAKKGKKKK